MKKKHIVIDARESGTSTGRYIDKLVEYLHELRPEHTITVLTKPSRVEYVKSIAPRFRVVVSRYKEFTFAEQFGLYRQLKKLKPDLVHFGMTQQPILYRGKSVTTIHDLTTATFKNPAKNAAVFFVKQIVYRAVIRIAARKSVTVITPSEFVKDAVAKFARINSRQIIVTYEAADKISDKPCAVPELEHKQFFLYIGRPQPHKNLATLVNAYVSLRQKHPEVRLVFAGKKDVLYKRMEKDIRTRGIRNVVFTGFVSEGELRWLYEQAQAYVFPSLSEGFGLPGLEAMAHKTPVISSNASCLPEIYQDGAIYFNPHDTNALAETMARLLKNQKLRNNLVRKGEAVARQYSWKRMAQQTLDIYRGALDI